MTSPLTSSTMIHEPSRRAVRAAAPDTTIHEPARRAPACDALPAPRMPRDTWQPGGGRPHDDRYIPREPMTGDTKPHDDRWIPRAPVMDGGKPHDDRWVGPLPGRDLRRGGHKDCFRLPAMLPMNGRMAPGPDAQG